MNGTTVEVDLGYVLTMAQGLGSNWVFWVVSYLTLSTLFGLFVVRAGVAEKLEKRKKQGSLDPTEIPPELLGVGGFVTSPIWVPFYLLGSGLWNLVAYPYNKSDKK